MKKRLLYISLLAVLSCCNEIEQPDLSTTLHVAPCKINIIKERQIVKNIETCFRLAPDMDNFKIIKAYYECGNEKTREYDTIDNRIKNCKDELLVKGDSVRIYFAQNKIGTFKFGNITLLLKDNREKLYFIDTTFYYDVVEPVK